MGVFTRTKIDVPCTIEINNTFEALGAHVRFDNGMTVYPGDEVMVQGAPVAVQIGRAHV